MPDRYRCRVNRATARPEKRDVLEELVQKMFTRRHHNRVGGRETEWLTVELVQSLRAESQVYKDALSTKTDGPLPFALGYFRLHDDQFERVSDEVPANMEPRVFVLFLSEFLQPGARFWFADEKGEEGWEVRGVGEVAPLSAESEAAAGQTADDESVGANN
ncbi:MAG: hypothetical protein BRD31_02230 [Bacteroidetes bacterium QH_2_64_26]|nr:MAG: hypothetical protein BRD31_02230 [Bacteroidetes bacterium QH_2_64_26]